MNLHNLSIKTRQYLLAGGVGLFGVIIFGTIIYYIMADDVPTATTTEQKFGSDKQIASLSNQVNPQEIWVERVESQNKLLRNEVTALQKLILENVKSTNAQSDELNQLKEELIALKNPTSNANLAQEGLPQANNIQSEQNFDDPRFANNVSSMDQPLQSMPTTNPYKITIALKTGNEFKKDKRKTVENTIPAGAYATAIMLGGVDAATSVNAQGDPRPVLLRVTDHGNLPRRFKSDLKACHVLASSYGDLSSERVYMRLEKLTCTEPLTGEIVETQVAGYVTGEDGRAGVRGTVVDRAGQAVRNSFVAGFVGGMGSFLGAQQQRSVFPVSPFGQTNALDANRMLGAGASQGVNNAMEKLADFYIKRADQLQPVLQVAAGREVNIIFTQGSDIGSSSVKQAIKKVRDQSRHETISKLEGQSDQSNWLPSQAESENTQPSLNSNQTSDSNQADYQEQNNGESSE